VTVVNPTNAPVPTTNANEPALQPFQVTLSPHSSTTNNATDYFTVPAGKRLVIEYYNAFPASDLAGATEFMSLQTTAGGVTATYRVFNVTTFTAANQTVRIYADPGTTVTAFSAISPPPQLVIFKRTSPSRVISSTSPNPETL